TLAAGPPHAGAASPGEAGDVAGPLDLADVTLEQLDVRMSLHIVTSGGWQPADLVAGGGRGLCVALVHGDPAIARGRVCVTMRGRSAGLSYTPLTADGTALATRVLPGRVSLARPGEVVATFLPVAAGLSIGAYSWWAESAWTDAGGCARTCTDRFPDGGAVAGGVELLRVPPCFGAAARDPLAPCENPALRLSVDPPLAHPRTLRDPYCDSVEHFGLLSVCAFGAAAEDAAGTFAVIGDSHAAGVKPALQVVSLAKRWRGISIVRSTCPATQAAPVLPTRARSRQCARWNRQVLRWLAAHREVQTVFLAAHARARVTAARGRDAFQTARDGYRDEILELLQIVPNVVVLRDNPSYARGHLRCLTTAVASGLSAGAACTQRRRIALGRDPLATAAQEVVSPQVRLVDLTPHFCDDRRCFAVVGGALVARDHNHMTPVFSATLGPYVLRALGG
ncbi:MAG: SGNH hydrolase domain-containing protein, partial [Solirubrobacteraceae bacterium]